MRVWKIMAGERSKFWKHFINEGIAAMKANEEGDLEGYSNKKEFLKKTRNFSSANKNQLTRIGDDTWNFIYRVKQGDLLLLYKQGYISAIGYVTGEYTYNETVFWKGKKFFHRRLATWKLLDTTRQKLPTHLRRTLSNLQGTLQELDEKEDILEVCHIASNELFCQETKPSNMHV